MKPGALNEALMASLLCRAFSSIVVPPGSRARVRVDELPEAQTVAVSNKAEKSSSSVAGGFFKNDACTAFLL
jgi:hypothetical protein